MPVARVGREERGRMGRLFLLFLTEGREQRALSYHVLGRKVFCISFLQETWSFLKLWPDGKILGPGFLCEADLLNVTAANGS